LILALLVSVVAVAQEPAACSFDTAAHTRPDTLILGLAPGRPNVSREVRADYLAVAEAIREQFNRPSMLRLPFAVRVVPRKARGPRSPFASYGLHGFVRFQLDAAGRLTNDPIVVSSASPDIVDAVVAAIQRADSNYAFPPPSEALRHDGGYIALRFVDTVDTKEPSVALMRLIVPTLPADGDPAVLSYPKPPYPPRALEAGVTGRVLIEFIIGTDSLMEPGSLQLLESPRSDMATAAVESLKGARLRPARIGSCSVPALVRLPVDFERARGTITGTVQSRP
jgi:hypothetical protein